MFINSWPSRAVLMIALQHAAWRRIKDSPLEQSEAELLAATDRAAPLTRDQTAAWAGKTQIRHLADAADDFLLNLQCDTSVRGSLYILGRLSEDLGFGGSICLT